MLKAAASMMSSMPPEQLEAMMGNLPGGLKMTPEMARMAAEQVGGVAAAASLQRPRGASAACAMMVWLRLRAAALL